MYFIFQMKLFETTPDVPDFLYSFVFSHEKSVFKGKIAWRRRVCNNSWNSLPLLLYSWFKCFILKQSCISFKVMRSVRLFWNTKLSKQLDEIFVWLLWRIASCFICASVFLIHRRKEYAFVPVFCCFVWTRADASFLHCSVLVALWSAPCMLQRVPAIFTPSSSSSTLQLWILLPYAPWLCL